MTMGRAAAVSVLMGLVLVAASCKSQRTEVEEPNELPILAGRFADEGVAASLVANEVYIGPDDFHIRYERADGLVYAGGRWSHRLDIAAIEQQSDGRYEGPYILPIEVQRSQRWTELPENPITPQILSSEQWLRFLNSLLASVLPEEKKVGVVTHFDADDYFVFLNERGDIETRLLIDKPADYTVGERISLGDVISRGMPQLEQFLESEGVTERRIVFNTGDAGRYALPFVYVDLHLPIAVFVRYPQAPREGEALKQGTQTTQVGAHIVLSNTVKLTVRPVSSVFRLLFLAKGAAIETASQTWRVTPDSQPIPPVSDGPGMDLAEWEETLGSLINRDATRGEIEYLIDGAEYFTRFIDAITTAQESVNIRTYIFDNDDYAEKIGDLLRRRSSEGIEVKVLLDGLGTILATGTDDESMPEDYVPPASVREFLERDSRIVVRQASNPWLAGDHVKTTIVDNKLAFTGGMNIGREYRYTWHDMMMELRGPVVDILNREFHNAWARAGAMGDVGYFFQTLKPTRDYAADTGYPVRVLFTRPGNAEIFRAQREAIRNAKSYIYVENAYFTDDAMLYELARARKRGVDVRVILPMVGNHGPINKSNALAANAMMEQGIRVYVYPGMSHVKAAIIDGWVCLGSANWDKLSFRVNEELNIATSHPAAVNELRHRLFDVDFQKSVELAEPIPVRWSDHLNEILADYLL